MKEDTTPWWQTLPGVLTGVAAVVTAIGGLILAVKQTGWFDRGPAPPRPPPTASATSPAGTPSPGTARASPVALPELRNYKLGEATFTLLGAEVVPQTTEKEALRLRIRMSNQGRYDANFWDRSFRLLVNDLPTAPESTLNELVPAQSARDGEVVFLVPRGTAAGRLKIEHLNVSTEITLAFRTP
jgi:hypothetical protein